MCEIAVLCPNDMHASSRRRCSGSEGYHLAKSGYHGMTVGVTSAQEYRLLRSVQGISGNMQICFVRVLITV
jgi:hypothetical protein